LQSYDWIDTIGEGHASDLDLIIVIIDVDIEDFQWSNCRRRSGEKQHCKQRNALKCAFQMEFHVV
jgi:hypothetical protein